MDWAGAFVAVWIVIVVIGFVWAFSRLRQPVSDEQRAKELRRVVAVDYRNQIRRQR